MKLPFTALLLILSAAALFPGGRDELPAPDTGDRLSVFVSILPQQFFVEQIGGDRVDVQVMVPPGKSPATYSPTPRQVSSLGTADVFFTIGVAFERTFLPAVRKNLGALRIADTSEGIERRRIEGHDHDEDHDHGDEEPDPHVWMSPVLVKKQGAIITDTLILLDPGGEDYYRSNYDRFAGELDSLDAYLEESLEPLKGQTMFVYHPAFGYFADRYSLRQVAVETGGKEPTPAQLENIIEHARKEKVRVIFVQPEFSADSAAAVADAIDGAVVTVAPLSPDYFENLKQIGTTIRESLEP